ncbi:Hypothetical predicted protein [Lynx pardinus]|uniref:60s ribosomal protein l31-like n=1 Tax=Lynx pardinus TaxID=191816 RepID=A0A485NY08_LYNPA|nr:Hypothetical predicted protein [Lynx pardinus]
MAPTKINENKEGHSAINKAVTREHTIDIHKLIHGVGFKKCGPWTLKEIWEFAMEEMGTSNVHTETRLHKAVWAEGIRNIPHISVCGCPENVMRMKIHQKALFVG